VLCIEKQKGKQNRHKVNNETAKKPAFWGLTKDMCIYGIYREFKAVFKDVK